MKFRHKSMTLLALIALLGLTVVLSACGGSSSSSGTSSSGSSGRTVDQAFVAEMIPHHEMAVEMAEMAQTEGQHPQITQLADNIIKTQSSEIEEMEPIAEEIGALGGSEGESMEGMSEEGMSGMEHGGEEGSSMSEDAMVLGIPMGSMGMSMDMSSLEGAKPFDRAFIDMMIPHHQGAILMAHAELADGEDGKLKELAKGIIAAQTMEIEEMNEWREGWYGSPSPAGGVPGSEGA
ncbi:MAG: DUF305 domain-containing protein [Actinobacteria bacterium]|nr:DUF305 domain-containing protein [Actinomycetota bacterium]